MSEEEVNWSYLPNYPEKFFECDENSTRRELKRAYNKILKKFKPEQYPEEFKKIRKAFEDLDAQMSYGLSKKSVIKEPDVQETKVHTEDSQDSSEVEDPFAAEFEDSFESVFESPFEEYKEKTHLDLVKLLDQGKTPEEILSQIESLSAPLPSDIILAAMIRESLDDDFLLLDKILKAYSDNPVPLFKNFLFQLLHSPCQRTQIEETLDKTADSVSGEDYFYFTEKLWFKYADEAGIDSCCRKISDLEEKIGYIPAESQAVFYRHFCKRYMFDLEKEFLEEKLELVEDSAYEYFWMEEEEVFFLNRLFEYRNSLDSFLNGSLYRERLHNIIKNWCKQDESLRHQEFINEIVNFDTPSILDPQDLNEKQSMQSLETCSEVIESICSEVREDTAYDELIDEEEKNKNIRSFMLKLEDATDNSSIGSFTNFFYLLIFAIQIAIVVVPSVYSYNYIWENLSDSMQVSFWRYLIFFGILGAVGALHFFTLFGLLFDKCSLMIDSLNWSLYKKIWRNEVIQFLNQNPITFSELRMELIYMENTKDLTNNSELGECLDTDHALRMFSAIQGLQI